MRELFKMADKDGDEVLTLKEILILLKVLNISVDLDMAKSVFAVSGVGCGMWGGDHWFPVFCVFN